MSLIKKKSASALTKKDVQKELAKIEEFEQDIEWSICQCVYTNPVMVDPCMHLYWSACIKSWNEKVNECPKCKETMKGFNEQRDVEKLLVFYTKLWQQEKEKLNLIKAKIEEREEIQVRINSILDQEPPKEPARPTTAPPARGDDFNVFNKVL